MPTGPPDKFDNTIIGDFSSATTPAQVVAVFNSTWTAFHTAYGVYPTVWQVVGTKMFVGGYH